MQQDSENNTIPKQNCVKCTEPDDKFMIQCSEQGCEKWLHYYCTNLPEYILTTYHEKKHRKFTCESCITINTDIKKHVEHFEELLGNKTSGITKTENSYESMKITFEDLQDKIINSLEKSQADSQEMLHLEQKLLQTQSQNIMLEKKVEDLEKSNKELNNDYISVHQAYNTLVVWSQDASAPNAPNDLLPNSQCTQ